MIPKITISCPSCNHEIVVTGIKLLFDNPTEPVHKAQVKHEGYTGWEGNKVKFVEEKNTDPIPPAEENVIRINNSGDPNEDIRKLIQQQDEENRRMREEIKKQESEDPNPFNDKVEIPKEVDTIKIMKPVIEESSSTAKPSVKQESVKQEELVPLLNKLISILDEKMYPELHTFIASMIGEEAKKHQEKHKTEEIKRKFSIW